MNYYQKRRKERQERGRRGGIRSQQVQSEKRKSKLPTVDEELIRAKWSRKGSFYEERTRTVGPNHIVTITMNWSVYGRIDQFDVFVDGIQLSKPMSMTTINTKLWSSAIVEFHKYVTENSIMENETLINTRHNETRIRA